MGNVFGRGFGQGYGTKNRRTPAQIRANLVERRRLMCSGRDPNSISRDKNTKIRYEDFSKVPTRQWVNDRFATSRKYDLPRNVRGEYLNLQTESERKRWRERYLNQLRRNMTQGAMNMKKQCAELTKRLSEPKLARRTTVAKRTKRATTSRR